MLATQPSVAPSCIVEVSGEKTGLDTVVSPGAATGAYIGLSTTGIEPFSVGGSIGSDGATNVGTGVTKGLNATGAMGDSDGL